jgi:hypothetical protein
MLSSKRLERLFQASRSTRRVEACPGNRHRPAPTLLEDRGPRCAAWQGWRTSASEGLAASAAGIYTLKLTLTDKDGASAQAAYQFVVVYDPSAGTATGRGVTGSGVIRSPMGAYPADPALTGLALAPFSFGAEYAGGATAPTGTTLFRFRAAGLSFRSTSYAYLVVSGPKAMLKGRGTIEGRAGTYEFLLTAIDSDASEGAKLRVKVWNSTGVVYDSQPIAPDIADPTTPATGAIIVN